MIEPPQAALALEAKIQGLPADKKSQVEDFVDFLMTKLTNQEILLEDVALRQVAAKLSEPAFAAVWDNEDDAVYDQL